MDQSPERVGHGPKNNNDTNLTRVLEACCAPLLWGIDVRRKKPEKGGKAGDSSRAFWSTIYPKYYICHVSKVAPKHSWGCPEWFQTASIFCLSPKLSNDGSYMGVPHHDPNIHHWFLEQHVEQHGLHQPPKNHVPNQKTTTFHRSSSLTAGPRHQSIHWDPIHHGRGRVGAAGLTETHASSNPGKHGRQDWIPRSIRHAKHTPCGRICHPSSPDTRRV